MQSLLSFIVLLGVLVFVHELGHFLMARRIGVRVLTFSLGFGPKLLRFRRGDTEYCVSVIPLGGYVKMAGENPDDQRTGPADGFLSKNKWERFQVMIMGPAMNIILAIVVMTVVLYQGAEVPAYDQQPPVVGTVAVGSPAAIAGIQPDDLILSVAGRAVDTWEEFVIAIMRQAGREIELEVRGARGERTVQLVPDAQSLTDVVVTPGLRADVGLIGVHLTVELRTIEPSLFGAFRLSLEQNYQWSGLIFQTLWGVLTRETPMNQLVGPLGIAQLSGTAAEAGWMAFFSLMAMVSLNLGILNLLPIPVLDGGHILILAMEGVTRRDFSMRVKKKMLLAGLVMTLMLIVTVMYNDLARMIEGRDLVPW